MVIQRLHWSSYNYMMNTNYMLAIEHACWRYSTKDPLEKITDQLERILTVGIGHPNAAREFVFRI